jgi:hypothetical protein
MRKHWTVVAMLISILALCMMSTTFVSAKPLGGLALARGSAQHVKPYSCFMNPVYSDTHNIVISGVTIGTYAAGLDQSTCLSTIHDVYGDMFLSGGACTASSIYVTWTVNGVNQSGSGTISKTIGPNSCTDGQEIFWESGTVTGHFTICAKNTATYSGTALTPNASVCHTF